MGLKFKLHLYSGLVLSRLTYGAAESWARTSSRAAQLETFHNSCMCRRMGRYWGLGGPGSSRTASRDGTGVHHLNPQPPQALGHYYMLGLLYEDSIPGHPRPVGRPHYTWMDGPMQDLSPGYCGTSTETSRSRSWCRTAICGGGVPAGISRCYPRCLSLANVRGFRFSCRCLQGLQGF